MTTIHIKGLIGPNKVDVNIEVDSKELADTLLAVYERMLEQAPGMISRCAKYIPKIKTVIENLDI